MSASDPASHAISLSPVLLANANNKSFSISLKLQGEGENADKHFETQALIDSGAGGTFLDKEFALKNKLALTPLNKPITVFNIDGTKNTAGSIDHCVWMKVQIGSEQIHTRFLVTGLGKDRIILGLPWLKEYNPTIDWDKGTVDIKTIPSENSFSKTLKRCIEVARAKIVLPRPKTTMEEIIDEDHFPKNNPLPSNGPLLFNLLEEEEVDLLRTYLRKDDDENVWINAKTSISQELAHNADAKAAKLEVELPKAYKEF